MYYFLLVVCSNNDSNLYRFRDITTFTVYMTCCDLEKSLIFEKTIEITSHMLELRFYVPLDTKYRSFRRRSSQPICWLGTEETKPSTTKESNIGLN